MTRLIIIRHGESETNIAPERIGGQSNHAPLTEIGMEQAGLLGKRLQPMEIPDTVITSPALRATQTAEIALAAAGWEHDIVVDERVVEQGHGQWEGLERSKHFTTEFSVNFIAGHGKAPGGESIDEVHARAKAFLESIENHGGTVVVFSHGTFTRILLKEVTGWSNRQLFAAFLNNTGITEIIREERWGDHIWRLRRYNDHAHLS